ncbi:MAG: hypothetical protein WCV63_05050 [Negativicutes bacterium]
MGDLAGNVTLDTGNGESNSQTVAVQYRERFKKFSGKIYLPRFAVFNGVAGWRELKHTDIAGKINWLDADLKAFDSLVLTEAGKSQTFAVGLSDDVNEIVEVHAQKSEYYQAAAVDLLLIAKNIQDIVPNPWLAWELSKKAVDNLGKRYKQPLIAANIVFVIEELAKLLQAEENRLAEAVFRKMISDDMIRLFLAEGIGYCVPDKTFAKTGARRLTRGDGSQLERSLFEYVPQDGLNDLEIPVALYLDEHDKLLWWFRNLARREYSVRGWQRNAIYPDFVFAQTDPARVEDYEKVYVVETKGVHLKNEDTDYKQAIFRLCNELVQSDEVHIDEFAGQFSDKKPVFEVVFGDEWKRKLNGALS